MKGKEIKIWLLQHDMTQEQLADRLGLARRTIGTYCAGKAPDWFKFALRGLEK